MAGRASARASAVVSAQNAWSPKGAVASPGAPARRHEGGAIGGRGPAAISTCVSAEA